MRSRVDHKAAWTRMGPEVRENSAQYNRVWPGTRESYRTPQNSWVSLLPGANRSWRERASTFHTSQSCQKKWEETLSHSVGESAEVVLGGFAHSSPSFGSWRWLLRAPWMTWLAKLESTVSPLYEQAVAPLETT